MLGRVPSRRCRLIAVWLPGAVFVAAESSALHTIAAYREKWGECP